MDPKTLLKVLKVAVREVIKEELTEILREGLQSTVTEMKQPAKSVAQQPRVMMEGGLPPRPAATNRTPKFNESRYSKILNETDPMEEHRPLAMNSFSDLVNEGMDEIRMTSKDARGFGQMRDNMRASMMGQPAAPQTMQDPETGKTLEVTPDVAAAMTRDYSALMKAMNNKKGR
jgi:hypothetical protein